MMLMVPPMVGRTVQQLFSKWKHLTRDHLGEITDMI
jgi:hypothetical protein